jgi:hypothetical protein
MSIQPSGVLCSSCKKEIDLFDGALRKIGKPKQFPFCWECWHELLSIDLVSDQDVVTEDFADEIHIWLEDSVEKYEKIMRRNKKGKKS